MKVGLGNFWNVVVISLVVEKAEKFTRLSTSGCGLFWLFMCLGGYVLGHVGWEYECEV